MYYEVGDTHEVEVRTLVRQFLFCKNSGECGEKKFSPQNSTQFLQKFTAFSAFNAKVKKVFFHRYSPLILHYFLTKPRPGTHQNRAISHQKAPGTVSSYDKLRWIEKATWNGTHLGKDIFDNSLRLERKRASQTSFLTRKHYTYYFLNTNFLRCQTANKLIKKSTTHSFFLLKHMHNLLDTQCH